MSFVGFVLVVRATTCVGIDFIVGQMFGSTLETPEVLAEVSTSGLITMTFALKTKNDDITALITSYIFVNYAFILPLSSYLIKSKVVEPTNEYSSE